MTNKSIDYRAAGVDYSKIDPLKIDAQRAARETAGNLAHLGLREIAASRGESAYVIDMGDFLLASITECLGTKVLIADAMRPITGKTYFDALAQDTLAMAINDIITVGATPVSVQAYWAAGSSAWFDDKARARDLVQGWKAACDKCGVSWGGGETPSLAGVVNPDTIDLAASCIGIVRPKERLTIADKLAAGDAIVLLASSGIHANGVSLARKVAADTPEGYKAKLSDGRMYGDALLDPTVLYSPATEALFAAGIVPHYCANITGHGWRKIMRHPSAFTYRFHTIAPVPPVLAYLHRAARMTDAEAYGTFNMGAGFALFVNKADAEKTVRAAKNVGVEAWVAGQVEAGPKSVVIEPIGVSFTDADMHLRA
ncbi:MAG: phosphoribosylformylglycinamidine cyclo-ligase [Rhodospirillaceae bacterium]|nr:phosphoribosylformylglycinamidine cyclo-ligase [Rhodospirillaceae bacterium]